MSSLTVLCTGVTLLLVAGSTLTHSQKYYRNDNLAWERFNISSVVFDHLVYHSRRVEIWEHAKNQEWKDAKHKRFYLTPLCELDPTSAATNWNNVTRGFEVRFAIRMWDDPMIEAARKHLNTEDPTLQINRVQMLPIQTVAVRCPRCKGFAINGDAMQVTSLPKQVYFNLHCDTTEGCGHLVSLMKSKPEQFQILKVLFAFQGQQLHEKTISIEFDAVLNGDLLSNVKELLPGKQSAYLLSEDARLLIRQSLYDIQSEYLEDTVILGSNYVKRLNATLNSYLVQGGGDAAKLTSDQWDQWVFWPIDAAVPRVDILTKRLTEIHSSLSKEISPPLSNEAKKALENLFKDVTPKKGNDPMSRETAEEEIRLTFGADDVKEFVTQARKFVRWNGSRFTTKSMALKRIRLVKDTDNPKNDGSFQLTVKFYPAALDKDVRVLTEDLPEQSSLIFAELSAITQTNITKEIQHLKARIMESEMVQTARKQYLATGDALATNASILMDRHQDLATLANLVAHYHSKEYIPNEPSWYSSVRLSLSDAINSLSQYGLVSYLPPAEPLWVAYINGTDATLALNNFWGRSTNKSTTIKLSTANTSFVWDPVNDKVLFFNGKNLREFPYEQSRHEELLSEPRRINTDGPWRKILDMSFDWITRNLFILSSTNYFIFVLSIEKPYTWTQLKCSQTNDVIEKIQVDPTGGYLFWAAKSSYIRRSWLNGSNLTTVWSPERPYNISAWSLTIDHETGTLYTIDSTQKVLLELNREGDLLRTIPLKWSNGEEANLFATNKNLNKVPNGLVVMDEDSLYFIDLRTEIVHVLDHQQLPTTTRYHVFYPDSKSYPLTTNPCSRKKKLTCLQYAYRFNLHEECTENAFTPTACKDSVCLHNPTGNYTCH